MKFCVHYKIALLTCKCIHGTFSDYLQNLISYYPASSYNLRVSNDPLLLKIMSELRYKKSESVFSCASSHVWNSLPLSLREMESMSRFKKQLKCHYFSIAFEDVNDILYYRPIGFCFAYSWCCLPTLCLYASIIIDTV